MKVALLLTGQLRTNELCKHITKKTLIEKSEMYHDMLMPGYTHLQVAQPVTFGHHLLAYVEMIDNYYF